MTEWHWHFLCGAILIAIRNLDLRHSSIYTLNRTLKVIDSRKGLILKP